MNKRKISKILVLVCLLYCSGCTHHQAASQVEPFASALAKSGNVSATQMLWKDKKLVGFLMNPKVTAMQDGKIVLIADDVLFEKNGIDLAKKKEIVSQIEETNRGFQQWIEEGIVTKEQLYQNFVDAQKGVDRKIKE